MAKAKQKFPKKVFLKEEGDKDKFLSVYEDIESTAEFHEVEVGVYALVRVAKVRTKVEVV